MRRGRCCRVRARLAARHAACVPPPLPRSRYRLPAAHIPLYLYPFLNTGSRSKPFEYLRLTSLGVIGALVKVRAVTTGWRVGRLLPLLVFL